MTNETKNYKITSGKIPATKIRENPEFIAFADIKPVGERHSIVMPKKHFKTIIDLDNDTSQKYFGAIKNAGKILMDKYNKDGFNSVLNNSESAGQVIQHVHFHVFPRKKGYNKSRIFIGSIKNGYNKP
jgi:histidine triad (HIT) family protein